MNFFFYHRLDLTREMFKTGNYFFLGQQKKKASRFYRVFFMKKKNKKKKIAAAKTQFVSTERLEMIEISTN